MRKPSRRAPELRFKGFTEDWEQRKLGELGEFKNGMNFGKEDMGHGYPFVNLQDVFGKNVVKNFNLGLAKSSENQRKEYSLNKGDVLFIRSSVKPEGVGENALVPHDFPDTTYSGFIIRFRPNIKMADSFKKFAFSTKQIRSQIMAHATSSANTNINQKSLQKIKLKLPSIEEQTKIGLFLVDLDYLITLHQRKLDALKRLKEAYLQSMFPKNGESEPKLRFIYFSGDWEQRKLGEVADIVGGGTPSTTNPDFWGGSIDWYSPVEIGKDVFVNNSSKKITNLGLQKSSARLLPAGTVLFTSRAGIGDTAILAKEGTTNQGFQSIVPIENLLDSYFIYSRTKELKRYGERNGAGSTFVEVSGKQMAKMDMLIPTLNEQIVVGKTFKTLDKLIILQLTKLNHLKLLKKSYLQKMFI